MNWTIADFLVAGCLLAVLGSGAWWVARPGRPWSRRLADFGMIGSNVLLIWINGAVGVIGTEDRDANLLYLILPVFGIAGAAASRWTGRARYLASLASAMAMVLIGGLALAFGWGEGGARWPVDVLSVTAVFTAGFLFAAWLYRQANQAEFVQAASSRAR